MGGRAGGGGAPSPGAFAGSQCDLGEHGNGTLNTAVSEYRQQAEKVLQTIEWFSLYILSL